jgi:hypothetical protein
METLFIIGIWAVTILVALYAGYKWGKSWVDKGKAAVKDTVDKV